MFGLFSKPKLPTWPFILILMLATATLVVVLWILVNQKQELPAAQLSLTAEQAPTPAQYQTAVGTLFETLAQKILQDSTSASLEPVVTQTREELLKTTVPKEFKALHLALVITLDKTRAALQYGDTNQSAALLQELVLLAQEFRTKTAEIN